MRRDVRQLVLIGETIKPGSKAVRVSRPAVPLSKDALGINPLISKILLLLALFLLVYYKSMVDFGKLTFLTLPEFLGAFVIISPGI